MSYLNTSRGVYIRGWREDVYDSRTCYCVRRIGFGDLRINILDSYVVLIVGEAFRLLNFVGLRGQVVNCPSEWLWESIKPG